MAFCASIDEETDLIDAELNQMHQQDKQILKLLLLGAGECGKCWSRGTPLLMFDGRTKLVEQIQAGDQLMGDDSTPRTVQPGTLQQGVSTLYEIRSKDNDGLTWQCNSSHVLVLQWHEQSTSVQYDARTDQFSFSSTEVVPAQISTGDFTVEKIDWRFSDRERAEEARSQLMHSRQHLEVECTVEQFMKMDGNVRKTARMFRPARTRCQSSSTSFASRVEAILGQQISLSQLLEIAVDFGSSIASGYAKLNSSESRALKIDGLQRLLEEYQLHNKGLDKVFQVPGLLQESESIRQAVVNGIILAIGSSISRDSVLLSASHPSHLQSLTPLFYSLGMQVGKIETRASEEDSSLHCMMLRNASNSKSSCSFQFTIEEKPPGEWFGFTVDGNGRVLMSDFTVSHNSTILKQMQILSKSDFTAEEKSVFTEIIRTNILTSLQGLVNATRSSRVPFSLPESNALAESLLALNASAVFPSAELLHLCEHFWIKEKARGTFGAVLGPNSKFVLMDSGVYFLDSAARCLAASYVPTHADILRSRVQTNGINEYRLQFGKDRFMFVDVGGQRGERKKWIQCFSDVSALFYVASLSEYNQSLAEDPQRNRMAESLQLFEAMIHQKCFTNTPVILFLNKVDVFLEKIKSIDLGIYCPAYKGGCQSRQAMEFISDAYLQLAGQKKVYIHITNATDTKVMEAAWTATKDIVCKEHLKSAGLLV